MCVKAFVNIDENLLEKEVLEETEEAITMMINDYKKNSTKKWIVCLIVTLLGILPSFLPYGIYRVLNSLSNRKNLDDELESYFG